MRPLGHKSNYINRELSWLEFNQRVLSQAADIQTPLFERLKFLSITVSNLDEFFMVRVAGLKDQVKMGYNLPDNKTQLTPEQQLNKISIRTHTHVRRLYSLLSRSIIPSLKKQGIHFVPTKELSNTQREYLTAYYHQHIFPVLTPLAINASHPFPMLAGRTLNLAVLLNSKDENEEQKELFAVVQVPSVLPRYIRIPSPSGKFYCVLLENVIREFMDTLFPGNQVLETALFRITRNADISVDEEGAEDLLEEIEKELKKRKSGAAVRLEVESTITKLLLHSLQEWVELDERDFYAVPEPLDLRFFSSIYNLPEYDQLRYEPLVPQPPQDFIGEVGIFETIARKDVMLFHPYESFEPVAHFVRQAAEDPKVLAIKQTLYRISGNSPVVGALVRAAENGKQVTVLLELKARFDEENNIVWAKKLEESGCHVIYGVFGLKTHSKITLIVRKEGNILRRYVHLGTGNYNDITARLYTDIGMFTAREDFGMDASEFFNHLTGFSATPNWRIIEAAPTGLKEKFLELIENEIRTSTPEQPGRIIAKMNSLTDKDLIMALYKASCHGIQIDLIVRGICCLRPGIRGVSENIRVSSIIGRFLEHCRIYYFENHGDNLLYLSSADLMTRNMLRRVEILFPVVQKNLKDRVKHILDIQLSDNVNRYLLTSRCTYQKVQPSEGQAALSSQLYFYQEALNYPRTTNVSMVENDTRE